MSTNHIETTTSGYFHELPAGTPTKTYFEDSATTPLSSRAVGSYCYLILPEMNHWIHVQKKSGPRAWIPTPQAWRR